MATKEGLPPQMLGRTNSNKSEVKDIMVIIWILSLSLTLTLTEQLWTLTALLRPTVLGSSFFNLPPSLSLSLTFFSFLHSQQILERETRILLLDYTIIERDRERNPTFTVSYTIHYTLSFSLYLFPPILHFSPFLFISIHFQNKQTPIR